MTLTFIETPVFSHQLAECVDDEEFRAFQNDLIPDFSFDELLTIMRQGADHAAGKITARTHQLTTRAEVISASEIAAKGLVHELFAPDHRAIREIEDPAAQHLRHRRSSR